MITPRQIANLLHPRRLRYTDTRSSAKALAIISAAIMMLILAEGCASIGNPSGGPRDERPPRFVKADPAPGAVNVSSDRHRFRIEFDELIDVKDPTSKVIISPPGAVIPRVSAQGRHVEISFQDSLMPNTTYTIDFADAIQDINENNPVNNFAYTFSTGPVLDSLRIAGRVLSARAMEPLPRQLVGL
ncbi:MAG: Ig-like domain-containing protein, partial [Muribaculaceae bacterium]|nr:Ig-like domain-containing protein [Muribaculaceae bacterium]